MNRTDIEYLDYTWNPTKGCSPVSEGCANCWAKRMSKRLAGMDARGYLESDSFAVECLEWKLDEPLAVKKPARIGVSFMGDPFHDEVPFEFVDAVWSRMSRCPQHTFIILTKRPKRMAEFVSEVGVFNYDVLPNVQLGVSVSNQKDADEFIPILLKIPASVRFVSVEPMLGPVDLSEQFTMMTCLECGPVSVKYWTSMKTCIRCRERLGCASTDAPGLIRDPRAAISWVICGAETGPGARPMEYKWAVDLFDQCQAAGVPFFSKADPSGGRLSIRGQVWEQYP